MACLSLRESFTEATQLFSSEFANFVQVLAMPAILASALSAAVSTQPSSMTALPLIVATFWFISSFFYNLHRLTLIGTQGQVGGLGLKASLNSLGYFFAFLPLFGVATAIFLAPSLLGMHENLSGSAGLALFALLSPFVSVGCLSLVALAIHNPASISRSWALSAGSRSKLGFLLCLLVSIQWLAESVLVSASRIFGGSFVYVAISAMASTALLAYLAVIFTVAYGLLAEDGGVPA